MGGDLNVQFFSEQHMNTVLGNHTASNGDRPLCMDGFGRAEWRTVDNARVLPRTRAFIIRNGRREHWYAIVPTTASNGARVWWNVDSFNDGKLNRITDESPLGYRCPYGPQRIG